jgi:hypothetical protein
LESSGNSDLHRDVNQVNGYGMRTELMTPGQAYDAGHDASVEQWPWNRAGTRGLRRRVLPRPAHGDHCASPALESAAVKAVANEG